MTLVGINWFAVAIAVAVNMLYGHFRYIPKLEKYLDDNKDSYNGDIYSGYGKYLLQFVSSIAMAVAIWNLLANLKFTLFLMGFGIHLPFYVLPRFTFMTYGGRKQALTFMEQDKVFFEVLTTAFILSIVILR
jgi:hypothetical protein